MESPTSLISHKRHYLSVTAIMTRQHMCCDNNLWHQWEFWLFNFDHLLNCSSSLTLLWSLHVTNIFLISNLKTIAKNDNVDPEASLCAMAIICTLKHQIPDHISSSNLKIAWIHSINSSDLNDKWIWNIISFTRQYCCLIYCNKHKNYITLKKNQTTGCCKYIAFQQFVTSRNQIFWMLAGVIHQISHVVGNASLWCFPSSLRWNLCCQLWSGAMVRLDQNNGPGGGYWRHVLLSTETTFTSYIINIHEVRVVWVFQQ